MVGDERGRSGLERSGKSRRTFGAETRNFGAIDTWILFDFIPLFWAVYVLCISFKYLKICQEHSGANWSVNSKGVSLE